MHKTGLAAALAAIMMPVGLVGPAEASTSLLGCTAERPKPPIVDGYTTDGLINVRNRVTVHCDPNREVQFLVRAIERDGLGKPGDEDGVNDIPSTRLHPSTRFGSTGGSITFRHDWGMKHLDKDRWNEIQHCVQFRARVNNGAATPGPWTGWTACEYSPVRSLSSARLLVPAYLYPDGTNWQQFCRVLHDGGHSAVLIMNPNSGPGATADANYRQALADCQRYGHTLIGYVATTDGRKSLADVKKEVDRYRQLYPDLRGIFLDEMSTDAGSKPHYRDIYTYIKAGSPRALVVGNPGAAAATAWQLTTPRVADVVVSFEQTAAEYVRWSPPAWTADRALWPRLAHLVHTTPQTSIPQVCAAWRQHPSSYIYVTPDVMPNPWDTWSLGAAAQSCLTSPPLLPARSPMTDSGRG